jgi:(p)ppGpp synthase/HD superfamily hydrolase
MCLPMSQCLCRCAQVCHAVYSLIAELWEEVPGRYKNYVDHPKPNG